MSELKRYMLYASPVAGGMVMIEATPELRAQYPDAKVYLEDRHLARAEVLETALAGMLFSFDDGVGRKWSKDLLDFARKLTAAKEFKAALKPAEGGGDA